MHWISLIPLYTKVNWSIGSSGNIFSAFMAWLRSEWKVLSPRISPVGNIDPRFLPSPINFKNFVTQKTFFEREEGTGEREREREPSIRYQTTGWLPHPHFLLGVKPTNWHVLRKRTSNLSVRGTLPNQLSPTSQDVTKKIFVKQYFLQSNLKNNQYINIPSHSKT